MAKVGDMVRFLNTTGGGRITKIEGKIVYVEEDGFETPVLMSDIVVVLPAGHQPEHKGASLMFDQKAFDKGKEPAPEPKAEKTPEPEPEPELPVEETEYGEKMNIALAFEPRDIRKLSTTTFGLVLVNDSNYYLSYILLRRSADDRGWSLIAQGALAPNELNEIATYTHENISEIERFAFQCVAYKRDKSFTIKPPVGVSRRLDLTKFHKLHCFRPGIYFDNPVLEIQLVRDDIPVKGLEINGPSLEEAIGEASHKARNVISDTERLAAKYKVEKQNKGKAGKNADPAANPHKLLPLIEVDLHIGELVDSTMGMEPKDMLMLQLDTVRKTMKENNRRIGQKIVFIHGKGEGVLRSEVLKLLKKEYPKAELQDASFREYGFGATLVTIH